MLIAILLAILVAALGVNYYFHQREERARQRQLRSRQLKKEIQQSIDALTALKTTQAPAPILALLSEYSSNRIGQLAALNPQAGVVDQLRSRTSPQPVESAAATGLHSVQLIQSAIRVTLSIARLELQEGHITPLQLAEFSRELSWLHTTAEADIYINEGKKLMETGKLGVAISHFKHAKVLVSKVPSKEARRQPKLGEINQLLDQANPFKGPAQTSEPDQNG